MSTNIVIYNDRKTGKQHYINELKRSLFNQLRLEEYYAIKNQIKFVIVWDKVYEELTNMLSK